MSTTARLSFNSFCYYTSVNTSAVACCRAPSPSTPFRNPCRGIAWVGSELCEVRCSGLASHCSHYMPLWPPTVGLSRILFPLEAERLIPTPTGATAIKTRLSTLPTQSSHGCVLQANHLTVYRALVDRVFSGPSKET